MHTSWCENDCIFFVTVFCFHDFLQQIVKIGHLVFYGTGITTDYMSMLSLVLSTRRIWHSLSFFLIPVSIASCKCSGTRQPFCGVTFASLLNQILFYAILFSLSREPLWECFNYLSRSFSFFAILIVFILTIFGDFSDFQSTTSLSTSNHLPINYFFPSRPINICAFFVRFVPT